MGLLGSATLKLLQTILYFLTFCCAAVILGVYSYFLAILANNDLGIATRWQAVTGIAGAAVIYLAFAILLTCFFGGIRVFAYLAILLNLLFAAAFIAIAVLIRDGAQSCEGNVETPIGNGPASSGQNLISYPGSGIDGGQAGSSYRPDLGLACELNRVAFALAIIGAILFLLMIAIQFLLAKKHKQDKQHRAVDGHKKRRPWQRKRTVATQPHVESGYTTEPKHIHHDHHTHPSTIVNGTGTGTGVTPHPTTTNGTTSGYTGTGTGYTGTGTGTGTNTYGGTTVVPGQHMSYDTSGRPTSTQNPYQTGPTGPYTNY